MASDDAATPVEQLVLLNTFTIRKRVHRVVMHDAQLIWQEERSQKDRTVLPLSDLISVRLVATDPPPTNATTTTTTSDAPCHPPTIPAPTSFLLHFARRSDPAASVHPSNVWRVHSRRFCHQDPRTVRLWADALQRHLAGARGAGRPRHLLVFVNPFGGRQQSLRIYEKWAKPLFELAGCEADVVVSQRPNQIGDILLRHRLEGLDGVVCVGGDGTVSEVLNGLVQRAIEDPTCREPDEWERRPDQRQPVAGGAKADKCGYSTETTHLPRPNLPVGIIPGGSTDTIAYCLHGTTDIRTAVIHIVLGQRTGLDLSSVSDSSGRLIKLYASVMSYGYLGDVAADSERFRWMGPRRYDYSGFKKFIANRGYEGEILIPDEDEEAVHHPDDGILCLERCPRCSARAPAPVGSNPADDRLASSIKSSVIISSKGEDDNEPSHPSVPVDPIESPINSSSSTTPATKDDDATDGDDIEVTTAADGRTTRWRVLRGKFFMVNGANLSCACPRSPNGFSRFGHVGDGRVDLVLVRHTPMLNNLRLLQKLASRTDRISELPFVEIHRVRRFRFRAAQPSAPSATTVDRSISVSDDLDTSSVMNASTDRVLNTDDSSTSSATQNGGRATTNGGVGGRRHGGSDRTTSSRWNCDGEVITDSDIAVESHCQLVNVFRRGPTAPEKPPPSETSCAGRMNLCGF